MRGEHFYFVNGLDNSRNNLCTLHKTQLKIKMKEEYLIPKTHIECIRYFFENDVYTYEHIRIKKNNNERISELCECLCLLVPCYRYNI